MPPKYASPETPPPSPILPPNPPVNPPNPTPSPISPPPPPSYCGCKKFFNGARLKSDVLCVKPSTNACIPAFTSLKRDLLKRMKPWDKLMNEVYTCPASDFIVCLNVAEIRLSGDRVKFWVKHLVLRGVRCASDNP
jgi:hypothetical protein